MSSSSTTILQEACAKRRHAAATHKDEEQSLPLRGRVTEMLDLDNEDINLGEMSITQKNSMKTELWRARDNRRQGYL